MPDTYSNQPYVIFMCVKLLQSLTLFLTKVVFLGHPDYKVLDRQEAMESFASPNLSQTWAH